VLLPPSARDATRTYMLAQLAARGITGSWTTGIPAVRPARFFTIEELNSASPFVFADAQLIQIRAYDADLGWLTDTTRLIKALWKVMPSERIVQDVEHAGGPLYDQDPDVPGLHYGQLVSWVTVICAVA
jgi:hypothetical protein